MSGEVFWNPLTPTLTHPSSHLSRPHSAATTTTFKTSEFVDEDSLSNQLNPPVFNIICPQISLHTVIKLTSSNQRLDKESRKRDSRDTVKSRLLLPSSKPFANLSLFGCDDYGRPEQLSIHETKNVLSSSNEHFIGIQLRHLLPTKSTPTPISLPSTNLLSQSRFQCSFQRENKRESMCFESLQGSINLP